MGRRGRGGVPNPTPYSPGRYQATRRCATRHSSICAVAWTRLLPPSSAGGVVRPPSTAQRSQLRPPRFSLHPVGIPSSFTPRASSPGVRVRLRQGPRSKWSVKSGSNRGKRTQQTSAQRSSGPPWTLGSQRLLPSRPTKCSPSQLTSSCFLTSDLSHHLASSLSSHAPIHQHFFPRIALICTTTPLLLHDMYPSDHLHATCRPFAACTRGGFHRTQPLFARFRMTSRASALSTRRRQPLPSD